MYKFLISIILTILFLNNNAQEELTYPELNFHYKIDNKLKTEKIENQLPLELPFYDDFANNSSQVDNQKWKVNQFL